MTASEFKPGVEGVFHGLPESVYRPSPGVSQSALKDFDGAGSPAHFKALPPKSQTEDMEFGTLVHTAVLEPDNFADSYYLQPALYPSEEKGVTKMKDWHGGANWCKDWTRQHKDRIVVKDKEVLARVGACRDVIINHPVVGAALADGKREVAYYKRDEVTGLLMRCKCDLVVADSAGVDYAFDLKKVQAGFANKREFSRSIVDRGYHIQAAYYMHLTGVSQFVFVAFDDDAPHGVAMWRLSPDFLELGRAEWRRILNAYAECVKTDTWPSYSERVEQLTMPPWLKRRVLEINEEEHKAWEKRVLQNQAA